MFDRRRALQVALVSVLGAVAGVIGNQLGPEKGLFGVPGVMFVVPFVIVVAVGAWIAVRLDQASGPVEDAAQQKARALVQLGEALLTQWSPEAESLGINETSRLTVSWTMSDAGMRILQARQWARRQPFEELKTWAREPRDMAGEDLELAGVWFERTPTRRLVLLGEGGAGKSQLLVKLMTSGRYPAKQVVPVLIPISAWDPTGPDLRDWLEGWLCLNYRFLSPRVRGGQRSLARTLLEECRFALVLDGFDEIPAHHARLAVHKLNTQLDIGTFVLLSSRPAEYAFATTPSGGRAERFNGAVCITIAKQEISDAIDYLKARALDVERWASVKAAVVEKGPLHDLFTTPLMVMLADAVYNEPRHFGPTSECGPALGPPVRDPEELMGLTSRTQIEEHLLDGFLEARYGLSPVGDGHPGRRYPGARSWRIQDVRRWLSSLAIDPLSRQPRSDWAWWEMRTPRWSESTRRRVAVGLTPLVIVLWTGLSSLVVNAFYYGDANDGWVAALRIVPAALFSYLLIFTLTESYRAALLATMGAYIAGVLTVSFVIAVGVALAAGFSWRPLRVRSGGWISAGGAGAAAALVSLLPLTANALPLRGNFLSLGGFAAGFAGGWVSRWDGTADGALATAVLVTIVVWCGAAAAEVKPTNSAPIPPWLRTAVTSMGRRVRACQKSEILTPLIVGVSVLAFTLWADGYRTRGMTGPGWRLAPAEALSVAFAFWLVLHWTRAFRAWDAASGVSMSEAPSRGGRVRRFSSIAAMGVTFFATNWLSYATRSNLPYGAARAAADGLGCALLLALTLRYSTGRQGSRDQNRPRFKQRLLLVTRMAPAAGVAIVAAVLDGLSQGWGLGVAYAVALLSVTAYFVIRVDTKSRETTLLQAKARPVWQVDPAEAFVFATALVGVIASMPYGLAFGLIFGLSSRVSLDVSRRSRPSVGMLPSRVGILGGTLLGSLIGLATTFTDIDALRATVIGVACGVAASFAFGTSGRMAARVVAMSPQSLLAQDRAAFLFSAGTVSVAIASAVAVRTAAESGSTVFVVGAGVSTLLTYGLTAGILVATAQSRYGAYTLTRSWLAAHGSLPWSLMAFLDDAHRWKGVLRRNGAAYQFRHEMLQEHLAQSAVAERAEP